ncbi:MAG: hypothetical protein QOG01_4493 [Pseudonocardiales bacterium]|jgi:hypothetical protein|nr:hypothetical protein [Pseudonocardiales bacterium]
MSWTWRYDSENDVEGVQAQSESFPSQSDAESWLGEHWRDLAANGTAQVTLYEGDRKVYGPMPLGEG